MRKSIYKKIEEKYNLSLLGKSFKDKYFLLKYSLDFHAQKIGMKSLWSNNYIEVNIKSNGNYYRVNTIDSIEYSSVFKEIFSDKQYEPIENIQNVKVVVDLGANIGLFAIYNNSYHKNAKLICIEPEAQNYKLLKKNIKMNNIKAITLQKAITDKQSNKLIKIYKSKSSTGYSINSNYSDEEEFFEAIGITLEKVCVENNIRSIDILKCDIEGAEKNIFINILGEFKNKIKYIILEYHSEEIRKIVIRSLKSDFNLTSHRKFGLNDIGLLTFRNKTKA